VTSVLFSPHSDDTVLWACFLTLKHEPIVVNVLKSQVQEDRGTGVTQEERHAEDLEAMGILGVGHFQQWPETDRDPDWAAVQSMMEEFDAEHQPEFVFAPAPEPGGHDQHNAVGHLAGEVFGERVTYYLTYTRDHGRSSHGREIIPEPWMIGVKLRALSIYQSQYLYDKTMTRTWFMDGIREWIVH